MEKLGEWTLGKDKTLSSFIWLGVTRSILTRSIPTRSTWDFVANCNWSCESWSHGKLITWDDTESKQSRHAHLLYCSSDGRFTAEGKSARLANFLCTGRIMIGAGLDMVCWGISNTLLACFGACNSFPLSSIFELPLHLGVRVFLNVLLPVSAWDTS